MLGRELLLPVDRLSYVRQLGVAAVVVQFKLWAGTSVALALWLSLTARQSLSLTDSGIHVGDLHPPAALVFWRGSLVSAIPKSGHADSWHDWGCVCVDDPRAALRGARPP